MPSFFESNKPQSPGKQVDITPEKQNADDVKDSTQATKDSPVVEKTSTEPNQQDNALELQKEVSNTPQKTENEPPKESPPETILEQKKGTTNNLL